MYLDISPTTFKNYINDGRLKEGVHFYMKSGKMVFNEDAIINLRQRLKG